VIIEKLLDLQKQEQETHTRAENEVYVTDLTRCAAKRYFEGLYDLPPPTEALVGKFLHEGFSSFVRQVEPEAQFEVPYKKEIDGVIIKGRVDVDLGPELWELKTGRDAPKDEPSEHHLLQCKIYLWLTGKVLARLIYITLNQFREFEITDPCTDDDVRRLLKDKRSPMFAWECEYCAFSGLCSKNIKKGRL
jgi:CRISPR-associated exonuclease Cas4